MLQIYVFKYASMWLGGVQVVLAESLEQALELAGLVGADYKVEVKPLVAGVVYEDDGDY